MNNKVPIKIDKGIKRSAKRTLVSRYPFDSMDVNDSFALNATTENRDNVSKAISAYKFRMANLGKKFSYQTREEGDKQVIRVWRLQ